MEVKSKTCKQLGKLLFYTSAAKVFLAILKALFQFFWFVCFSFRL